MFFRWKRINRYEIKTVRVYLATNFNDGKKFTNSTKHAFLSLSGFARPGAMYRLSVRD